MFGVQFISLGITLNFFQIWDFYGWRSSLFNCGIVMIWLYCWAAWAGYRLRGCGSVSVLGLYLAFVLCRTTLLHADIVFFFSQGVIVVKTVCYHPSASCARRTDCNNLHDTSINPSQGSLYFHVCNTHSDRNTSVQAQLL